MNKTKLPYRFFAITMASLMLLTSISFMVDVHFCGDRLVTVNFFGKAQTCHEMIDAAPDCPNHEQMVTAHADCSVDGEDCCHNESLHFEADQDRQIQLIDFNSNQSLLQFVIAYVNVSHFATIKATTEKSAYAQYRPPLISRDYSVLFQSFLI